MMIYTPDIIFQIVYVDFGVYCQAKVKFYDLHQKDFVKSVTIDGSVLVCPKLDLTTTDITNLTVSSGSYSSSILKTGS